jgi:hypothetical protein
METPACQTMTDGCFFYLSVIAAEKSLSTAIQIQKGELDNRYNNKKGPSFDSHINTKRGRPFGQPLEVASSRIELETS